MAHNPFELSRFLEAVRWEMPTELEEMAYQFRQSRLEDLGFPPLEEAMQGVRLGGPGQGGQPPAGHRVGRGAELGHVDLVAAAFRGLDEIERQNLEAEVR